MTEPIRAKSLAPTPPRGLPVLVRLLLLAKPWWPIIGRTVGAAMADQIFAMGLAASGALLVGQAIAGRPFPELLPFAALSVALALAKALSGWLSSWYLHDTAVGVLSSLRAGAYLALEPLAPAYTTTRHTGDIAAVAMGDIEQMQTLFSRTVAPAIVMLVVVVATLAILGWMAPVLALTLAPFLALIIAMPLLAQSIGDRVATRVRAANAELSAHMVDSVQGLRELAAFGRMEDRAREVDARSAELVSAQRGNAVFVGALGGATEATVAIGGLAVLAAAIFVAATGQLDRALTPLAMLLAFTAMGSVVQVADVAKTLNMVAAAARRYFEVVDEPVRVLPPAAPQHLGDPIVEFDDVTFRYIEGSAPVLEHVSFSVRPGETVALVGPSGSGKSTCAALMLRFWDVEAGSIRIGGRNVRDVSFDELRSAVAVVQQDNFLFNTTIRENLKLGRTDATDAEIEAAAREANVHEFITSLPKGYDTLVGERGAKLSGGQRQRIAIARALVKNAPILVLDEATSNLDTENERAIQAALARLMRGRTTLVIAHRLSTIAGADRVVMLSNGTVTASGTHTELLGSEAGYARMLAGQTRNGA